MPLLFDFKAARDSVPDAILPQHAGYPGGAVRAQWQVAESIRCYERYFGVRPRGCWPAEGAISEPTLQLLEAHGFLWAASGGTVAACRAQRRRPESGRRGIRTIVLTSCRAPDLSCFFREEGLSDLIGFTYATWRGDDAANNLVHNLGEMAEAMDRAGSTGAHAVLIALDGENAWEYYPFNGYWFLQALYAGLAAHPRLDLTTLSQCLDRGLQPLPLPKVKAGSWVHGTLATWVGDAAKNLAWDLLCDAKQAVDEVLAQASLEPDAQAAVLRQLALCESSDWFWWFGDYNPAQAVSQFDQLFRRQLAEPVRAARPPGTAGTGKPHFGWFR